MRPRPPKVAFSHTEQHKQAYFRHQQMVLEDIMLDIPGLAEAYKQYNEKMAAARVAGSSGVAGDAQGAAAAAADAAAAAGEKEGGEGEEAGGETEPEPEPVTLATFRQILDMLADQQSQMEALPAHADVHIIRVNLGELKAALLPAPTGCLEAMHQLLPELAAELFQGFMGEVQNALSRLQASSGTVEEYVEKIEFLTAVS